MNPLILGGLAWLGWKVIEEWCTGLAHEADDERVRLRALRDKRKRSRTLARIRAHRASLKATEKLIDIVKEERRAAATARNALPWRSRARDEAHDLVELLSRRIDRLYTQKKRIWRQLDGRKLSTSTGRRIQAASRRLIGA